MNTALTPPPERCPRERFILFAALSFVVMSLLAGPLRMYLSMAGLAPLIYVPNLLLMLAIGWQFAAEAYRGFSSMNLIAVLIPAYACVIGLQFVGPVQAAMGLYVLLPFWFGLVCGPVILHHWHAVQRALPLLWILVAGGILVNQFVAYPWEGFGYNLGELDVEGSRQWYAAGGLKRLAGLSRSSFDAAVQVQLLGILFVLNIRNPLLRTLLWIITIAAVIPTTSKGMLMVGVVLTPVVLLQRRLPASLLSLPLIGFATFSLALPVSTLLFDFHSRFSNPVLANATHSFYDRLNDMWPRAWSLLSEHGNILLGRGIGGIGTPQTYFEPSLFNAGDNLFMYWFVVFGWTALPGFILLLLRSIRIRPLADAGQLRIYCLLLATLVYGSMTNIVENALFAVVGGLVVRWLCSTPSTVASTRVSDRIIYTTLTQGSTHA